MKNINLKLVSSIIVVGLLAGCASKNGTVTYDDETNKAQKVQPEKKVIKVEPKPFNNTNNMEASDIVEDDGAIEEPTPKEDSDINEVVSIIDGKNIVLKSIHFGFDKYAISDDMLKISNENVEKINSVEQDNPNVKIKLEGNCDEWGTDEYNYALGLKRTNSVKKLLVKSGISSDKIVTVSYGESNPICTEKTRKCWKRNRRVDHKLLP